MTTSRILAPVAVSLLTIGILSGCSLTIPGAKNPTGPAVSGGASAPPSAASHQQPMKAVPTECPSPDVIAVSVHVSLPTLVSTPVDNGLECTYVDPAHTPNGLELIFGATKGLPVAAWKAKVQAADSSAVAVAGVGDGAFYGVKEGTGYMWFYSGAAAGYVYAPLPIGAQANLTALLADQIFVP